MTLAEMDGGAAAGWIGAALAVLSALGSLIVLLMNTRHRNRQEADTNALTPLREALAHSRETIERLESEIERRDAHISELNKAFEQLSEEHANCQVTASDLYGAILLQNDYVKRLGAVCKRHGEDPGNLPKLPDRPTRPDRTAMEFRARTLKQQSIALSESSVVRPKPTKPPDPSKNNSV